MILLNLKNILSDIMHHACIACMHHIRRSCETVDRWRVMVANMILLFRNGPLLYYDATTRPRISLRRVIRNGLPHQRLWTQRTRSSNQRSTVRFVFDQKLKRDKTTKVPSRKAHKYHIRRHNWKYPSFCFKCENPFKNYLSNFFEFYIY